MIPLNFSNLLERVCGPNTQTPPLHCKLKSVGLAALLLFLLPIVGAAQCLDCSLADVNPGTTPDLIVECEGDIGGPEDYLIVNPACPVGSIAVADVVTGGDGSNGNPQTITRTYTYDPGNGDPVEVCVQVIEVESQSTDPLDITCPADMIFNLDPGACEQLITYNVSATGQCVEVVKTSGIASGDAFPIGTSVVEYEATDIFDNTITCSFTVEVIEYDGDVDNLSCKADINVTVDDDCLARINPGMALSGDFLCYDNYTVTVFGLTPASAITGNGTSEVLIDASLLDGFLENGMTDEFDIMVSDGASSCWNQGWMLEDKTPPQICCMDFSINCIAVADPDNIVFGNRIWPATSVLPLAIPDPVAPSPFGILDVEVEVDACENIEVSGISIYLDVDHAQAGDLTVQLVSPAGTTALIFDRPGFPATGTGCTGIDIDNWFTNAGPNPHSTLEVDCIGDLGIIQAATPISVIFAGEPIGGTWIVRFIDQNENALTGIAENVRLSISGNYGEPLLTENCADIEPTYTDEFSQEGCSPFQTITRTWIAADAKGADTCIQTITVQRVSILQIQCPPNYDNIDQPALACNGGYPVDGQGHPAPTTAGTQEPTIDGVSIDNFCMFDRTYNDVVFPGCGQTMDIQRTWTIIDWCTGEDATCIQNIKIMDLVPPTIVCPADINLDAGNNCDAGVILPAPTTLTDNCSATGPIYTISATAGTLVVSGGNNILSGLPLGTTTVTYTAEDDCGNTSTCDYTITVEDDTPPPCVGTLNVTVNLSDTSSNVFWTSFIDQATLDIIDNCSPSTALIKRTEDVMCNGDDSPDFGISVPVFCCDVGVPVAVTLQLTDGSGNSNECGVVLMVTDISGQAIICPVTGSVNITCDQVDATLSTYEGVTQVPSDIKVYTSNWNDTGDTLLGFYDENLVTYTCFAEVFISDAVDLDNCGVGTITRTYQLRDQNGAQTASCSYDIIVSNPAFNSNTDVTWPAAEVTVTCDNVGTVAGPTLNVLSCDHIYVTTSDVVIPTPGLDYCFKILRTYDVWDCCAEDIPVIVTYFTQLIKVTSNVAPVVSCSVASASVDTDTDLEFSSSATDDCTDPYTQLPGVTYSYTIDQDIYDNANADITGTGTLGTESTGTGTNFPIGVHEVTITATNACGVSADCTITVVVNDAFGCVDQIVNGDFESGDTDFTSSLPSSCVCQAGSYCVAADARDKCNNSLWQTVLSPSGTGDYLVVDGSDGAVVWSQTVNVNGGSAYDFCMDYFPNVSGGGTPTLDVEVWDGAILLASLGTTSGVSGLWQKSCFTGWAPVANGSYELRITQTNTSSSFDDYGIDNIEFGTCDSPPLMSNVAGAISNEENGMLVDVEVSPGQGLDVVMTDDNGAFSMNLPTLENYNVTPVKDNDHLNGVSTYDIVLISKHLLDIELLDSPYKMIAADVNKSDHISTLDMLQLRKVILFIDDEFQNNTSWRFVDAGYIFNDPANPFGETFPESYPINGLEDNMEDIDFVAVKTGDVNGTASTSGFGGSGEDRTFEGDLKLRMQDQAMEADRTYFVNVKSLDFNEILGYQFTLGFDEDAIEIVDVVGADLPGLNESNFNLQRTAEGAITTSWNQQTALSLEDNAVLFTLEVRAKQDVSLSEVLNVSSRLTAAEAYQENGADVELMNIAFEYEDAAGEVQASNFELYQNRPNPFKNETMISFRLPEAGKASLKVYDISGKVLKLVNGSFDKGYNELNIDRGELNGSGVLYYELSTADHTAIQKMIVID